MEQNNPESTSESRLGNSLHRPEQDRIIDMTRETPGAENLLHIDITAELQGMSDDEKTQIIDDNLSEIKEQLDTAVRGVDGIKIENIEIGHRLHDNTAIILGDEDEDGELEEIVDNDEGLVVYIYSYTIFKRKKMIHI